MKGLVTNIQRYSLDDGDGIRTTVFLKGCPLTCLWCHNAETQSALREIAFHPELCIRCGGCVANCPSGARSIKESTPHYDRTGCISCAKCTEICPTRASEAVGEFMSCDEVLSRVLRDRPFFRGRGGMTISGGEPLSQPEFTRTLACLAKENGISVTLETSGFGSTEAICELIPSVDCFYFDCKADSCLHRTLTGVTDELILKNLDAVCRSGANVVLRCPIIPGANLTEAYIEKIASLANKYPSIREISLLPYHKTGSAKSEMLGRAPQSEFRVPTKEELDALKEKLRENTNINLK